MTKYTITETTETSSAKFTVKAKNNVGSAETTCELKIQESPKIVYDESLANQKLPMNGQWKIEIQVTGFPKPEVTWTKNGKKVDEKRVTIQREERTSTISISSLVREDTATYTAKAENQAGSSSVDLHLRVIDKPSKPQGPVVFREIRQDRVTLEWRPPADDGGIELEKYTIERCEPGKTWVKVVDIDKEVESFCVHKLQQNAEYKFRIIARNAVGASEPLESDTVKMRTSFGMNIFIVTNFFMKNSFRVLSVRCRESFNRTTRSTKRTTGSIRNDENILHDQMAASRKRRWNSDNGLHHRDEGRVEEDLAEGWSRFIFEYRFLD